MCGIVGLLLRDPALEASLGSLLVPMLGSLDTRGPDSAGVATYGPEVEGRWRLSLRHDGAPSWPDVAGALAGVTGRAVEVERTDTPEAAALLLDGEPADLRAEVAAAAPGAHVIGWGRTLDIVKGTGLPSDVAERYGIAGRRGRLAVAHTRMATESAVTAEHSHPFTTGTDLCVVHNGSFSNHASVRRVLQASGVAFDTDNDSEVAARYLTAHLDAGDSLEESVRWLTKELDGFFTLVVTTGREMSVVRDAFACKPAVVAEASGYVAVASEYRALATLPGIDAARVFEPQPEEVHTWSC